MNLDNKVVTHLTVYVDGYYGAHPAYVYAKQYDVNSRYVVVSVMSSGGKMRLDGLPVLNAEKPDGTHSTIDGHIDSNGDIVIKLTSQLLAVPGNVACDITVYGSIADASEASSLTTSTFYIVVLESQYKEGAVQSEDEMTVLQDALMQSSRFASEAESFANQAKDASEIAQNAARDAADEASKIAIDIFRDDISDAVEDTIAKHNDNDMSHSDIRAEISELRAMISENAGSVEWGSF